MAEMSACVDVTLRYSIKTTQTRITKSSLTAASFSVQTNVSTTMAAKYYNYWLAKVTGFSRVVCDGMLLMMMESLS